MQVPVRIHFRNMPSSPFVEARIRQEVEGLTNLGRSIHGCDVTVTAPSTHHHKGGVFTVRIEVRVPGSEVVVSREGPHNPAHQDVYVAIRDAFAAAEHQISSVRTLH